eukprot:scaffold63905_cov46-Attheya_sp.AAC.6
MKSVNLTMNMSSPRATAWISSNQVRIFGAHAVPGNGGNGGFRPPGGLPPQAASDPTSAALNATLTNLDMGRWASSLPKPSSPGRPRRASQQRQYQGPNEVQSPPIMD